MREDLSCYNFPVKIGIIVKPDSKKSVQLAKTVGKFIKGQGSEVLGDGKIEGAHYVLVFGGDGTLIHESCEWAHLGIPMVGINTGNLGFLMAVDAFSWKKAVEAILTNKIFISQRMTLEAEINGQVFRGVNEAVIKGLYRVVEIGIKVGGKEFLKVLGDGVMVATQTGSTAYSLSAGGPIVDPELDSFLVTPVNPIGLPIPSAVVSAGNVIEIELLKGEDVSLIVDGQEHTKISKSEIVKVKRGKHTVKFGYLDKHHFIEALNVKFGLASRGVR